MICVTKSVPESVVKQILGCCLIVKTQFFCVLLGGGDGRMHASVRVLLNPRRVPCISACSDKIERTRMNARDLSLGKIRKSILVVR